MVLMIDDDGVHDDCDNGSVKNGGDRLFWWGDKCGGDGFVDGGINDDDDPSGGGEGVAIDDYGDDCAVKGTVVAMVVMNIASSES